MRNCDFWRNPEEVNAMYGKYLAMRLSTDQKPTVVEWLYKSCDFALQLNVGDIIQYRVSRDEPYDVRYAKVTQINRDRPSSEKFVTLKSVGICFAGGTGAYKATPDHRIHGRDTKMLEPYHIKWPEIPEDFLRLMVREIPTTCPAAIKEKCPFKDEYKEPVPPCMKEEDDD